MKKILLSLLVFVAIFTGCKQEIKNTIDAETETPVFGTIKVNFPNGDTTTASSRAVTSFDSYESKKDNMLFSLKWKNKLTNEVSDEYDYKDISLESLSYVSFDELPYGIYTFTLTSNICSPGFSDNTEFAGNVGLEASCDVFVAEKGKVPALIFNLEEKFGAMQTTIRFSPGNEDYFNKSDRGASSFYVENLKLVDTVTKEEVELSESIVNGSLEATEDDMYDANASLLFKFLLPAGVYDFSGDIVAQKDKTDSSTKKAIPFYKSGIVVRGGLTTLAMDYYHPTYTYQDARNLKIVIDEKYLPELRQIMEEEINDGKITGDIYDQSSPVYVNTFFNYLFTSLDSFNSISTNNLTPDYYYFDETKKQHVIVFQSFWTEKNANEFERIIVPVFRSMNNLYGYDYGSVDEELYFYGYYFDPKFKTFFVDQVYDSSNQNFTSDLSKIDQATYAMACTRIPSFGDIVLYPRFEKATKVVYHVQEEFESELLVKEEQIPYTPKYETNNGGDLYLHHSDNDIYNYNDGNYNPDNDNYCIGVYYDSDYQYPLPSDENYTYITALPYQEKIDVYLDIQKPITIKHIYDKTNDLLKIEPYGSGNPYTDEMPFGYRPYWFWELHEPKISGWYANVVVSYGTKSELGWKLILPNGESYPIPENYADFDPNIIKQCLDENRVLNVYPNIDDYGQEQDYLLAYNKNKDGSYTVGLTQKSMMGVIGVSIPNANEVVMNSVAYNKEQNMLYYVTENQNHEGILCVYDVANKEDSSYLSKTGLSTYSLSYISQSRIALENDRMYVLSQYTSGKNPYVCNYPYSNDVYIRRNSLDANELAGVELSGFFANKQGCYLAYKKINKSTGAVQLCIKRYNIYSNNTGFYDDSYIGDNLEEIYPGTLTFYDSSEPESSVLFDEFFYANSSTKITDIVEIDGKVYALVSCTDSENKITKGGLIRFTYTVDEVTEGEGENPEIKKIQNLVIDENFGVKGLNPDNTLVAGSVNTYFAGPQRFVKTNNSDGITTLIIADAGLIRNEGSSEYSAVGQYVTCKIIDGTAPSVNLSAVQYDNLNFGFTY